jgi:ketosteroid isomerase-like protein
MNEHDRIVSELFDRTAAAQRAWVLGDASGYEALFSPAQLTIFGPFGGPALRGRTPGAAGRVAGLFSDGTAELELVDSVVSAAGDVACLIMVERCEATFAGVEGRRRWDLRTTQIYRRTGEDWFVIHRHAEPLLDSRDLHETLALLDQARS